MDRILRYIGRATSKSNGATGSDVALDDRWRKTFAQLETLKSLEDDWDGLGAQAPQPANVAAAVRWLEQHQLELIPPHQTVPGVCGEVVLIWQAPDWYLAVEINQPDLLEWILSKPGQAAEQWDVPCSDLLVGHNKA